MPPLHNESSAYAEDSHMGESPNPLFNNELQ